jgi:hypothetical protein
MTTLNLHRLAADYLERLRRAGRGLPRGRLDELLADLEAHLSEAIEPGASDAEALEVLDRLGPPEEIVEAEQPRAMAPVDPRGTREWAAVFLLLFGGFVFGLGWIAGLVLLWSSRAWSTREKWIGTLIFPGGLATAVYGVLIIGATGASESCVSGSGIATRCTGGTSTAASILMVAGAAVVLLAPVGVAIYLARRAR